MKRLLALLLSLILALSLAGCARKAAPNASTEPEQTEEIVTLPVITDDEAKTPDAPPNETSPPQGSDPVEQPSDEPEAPVPAEDGVYTSKEDVALYIHLYGHLPANFITKKDAEALGWPGGSLEPYAPGKCIGGGRFGNYEGLLPKAEGRRYTECDIDTLGKKSRGAKRIVFSNDGLIYYTEDHYQSFELLYGEE